MKLTRRCGILLSVLALMGASATAAQTEPTTKPQRPVPEIEHVLLISVDGCRPDVLLRAKTPNVHKLIESGSFTFWARTIPVAITLPSHASMLTGVGPEKHGITWNRQQEDADVARPKVPTIFELAMRQGLSTGMVAGKSKFDGFGQVGHIGHAWTKAAKDDQVAEQAVQMIRDYKPNLMFVHFPGADQAGHATGWASPQQVAALEKIDVQLGKVFAALDENDLRDKTVILLTADHGGAGRGHGISGGGAAPDDPRSQHIPWVIAGPGIRKNYDLSQDPKLIVRQMDTAATLLYLLGVQPEGEIEGKPVLLALEKRGELLQSSK
jgi:predicted AlkP superfamily pyrophosphatase or phosphodiesterase